MKTQSHARNSEPTTIRSPRVHPLLSEKFAAETDRVTRTSIREGNTVQLLPSGVRSYEKRWDLLARAKSTIHIVAFSLMRDETSKRLCDVLAERMQHGVSAHLILDDAVLYSTFSGNLIRRMRKAGVEVIRYHKFFRDILPDLKQGHPFRQLAEIARTKLRRHFHEKYMVIDGTEAILGGINWGNKYAFGGARPKAWRDSDVYLTGPIVADIQRQFVKDIFLYRAMEAEYTERTRKNFSREEHYQRARLEETQFVENRRDVLFPKLQPTGSSRIRYVPHKPYDENRLPLTEAYLLMFKQAQSYIYWGCHGIRPPRVIAETLVEAVRRGVDVRLITNSKRSSRTLMMFGLLGWMYWEASNHFRYLVERGINVYEWQKPGAFHSKNLVIDDVVASVGSYNVASGSTFYHTESNVIVYGGEFPHQVRNQFFIDLKDCKQLTLAETKIVPPRYDPFLRRLAPRNRLIEEALLTEAVRRDLKNHKTTL